MCHRKKRAKKTSLMTMGKVEVKATEVMLRDLETKPLAYLDEWRRELGIRNGLEVGIDREELRLAAIECEDKRRQGVSKFT